MIKTKITALLVLLMTGFRAESLSTVATSHILFIPGYYGSALVDQESKKTAWLSLSVYLFGRQSLANHRFDFQLPGMKTLMPTEVLLDVPIVPWIYSRPVYSSTIAALNRASAEKAQIHLLAYDWRQDIVELAQAIDQKVDKLRAEGVQKIILAAHSLGAITTAYYLRYGTQMPESSIENWAGAQKIDGAILGGAPYRGTVFIFGNMVRGAPLSEGNEALKPWVVASFPASYQILALLDHNLILNAELKPTANPYHDATQWQLNGWGLFAHQPAQARPNLNAEKLRFTQAQLARAIVFHTRLAAPLVNLPLKKIKLLNLQGHGTPTRNKAILDKSLPTPNHLVLHREDLAAWGKKLPENLIYADGDSSVTVHSSRLPDAYKTAFPATREKAFNAAHGAVFYVDEAQRYLRDFFAGI